MNPPHPIICRIEREHNYSRQWYKKINVSQKYPNRITKFLYLKNFPRHFLSKYPFAFSSNHDGTLDVGSAEDLQSKKEFITTDDNMDLDVIDEDLAEQENKMNNEFGKPEEPFLDTSMWTQQMDRLYYKILQILQQYYLTKLVYENLPNGSIRMVNLMENTSLQLRHSFANIAGWDNELLIWLHNLFNTKLHPHEHLIPIYHEVMQYLSKRLPSLIEKFYSIDTRIPSSITTTPATSAATTPVHPASGGGCAGGVVGGQRTRHSSISHSHYNLSNTLSLNEDPAAKFVLESTKSTPRRLNSNPLILLIPSGPSIPSQPVSARMEYWKILLSSMGQLINVNVPYRPEQGASEILQVIKASVRDKIRDTRKKKFNEQRPLVLVGFNQGSVIAIHCALDNPGQVSSIVCLGFPLSSINGFRGDLDDPILDMNIPILFVLGQMASAATLDALERLRETMSRSDTGLVVVGGANDKLIVSYRKKLYDSITQYHVDKSIADEIYDFVNSVNMQHPDVYS